METPRVEGQFVAAPRAIREALPRQSGSLGSNIPSAFFLITEESGRPIIHLVSGTRVCLALGGSILSMTSVRHAEPTTQIFLHSVEESLVVIRVVVEMAVHREFRLINGEGPGNGVGPHETDLTPTNRGHESEAEGDEEGRQRRRDHECPNQAQGWPGPLEHRPARARYENREVPSDRQLQEDERLNLGDVEVQPLSSEDEQAEGIENSDRAEDGRQRENSVHIPAHRLRVHGRVVAGDHHDGQVVEKRQHDDQDGGDGIEVEGDHREHHEDDDADGLRHSIDRVGVHPPEDHSRLLDGGDDHRKPRRGRYDRRGRASRVGRAVCSELPDASRSRSAQLSVAR